MLVMLCVTSLLLTSCATNLKSMRTVAGGQVVAKVALRGQHYLYVELENLTSNRVELRAISLPWRWRYSMWVKAFEDDAGGSPLDEQFAVADPPMTNKKVSLLPGKRVHGTIDLRDRLPELEEVLRRRDVVVFWSWVPQLANGANDSRQSGSLAVPRSR